MSDGKKRKVVYDWGDIALLWVLRLFNLLYLNAARWTLYFFLVLTPTLWAPREYVIFLSYGFTETPISISETTMDSWLASDAAGRCKTWTEKKDAISTSADGVSGWYGPGAYLAWLITAYVAAGSSIWHSKSSPRTEESNRLDGEVLLTVGYPMIALFDILVRLIRCKIDPGMTAAVFVVISSITVISPISRLSWQYDGEKIDTDVVLPKSLRQWTWSLFLFISHTIIYSILGEPYGHTKLLIAVYVVLFLLLLYSEINATALWETYPYRTTVYRPRAERLVVFGAVQIIFMVVLLCMKIPLWPETGARFLDLDQAAGFLITVSSLLYSRVGGILELGILARRFVSWRLSKQRPGEE